MSEQYKEPKLNPKWTFSIDWVIGGILFGVAIGFILGYIACRILNVLV